MVVADILNFLDHKANIFLCLILGRSEWIEKLIESLCLNDKLEILKILFILLSSWCNTIFSIIFPILYQSWCIILEHHNLLNFPCTKYEFPCLYAFANTITIVSHILPELIRSKKSFPYNTKGMVHERRNW